MSPYTTIVRRSGNPFELAHVCVSWLIGANYDAYVVVGIAKRDTCYAIRYRTECPEIPDEILFELDHVCVSWLIVANYDAYVVVCTAKRDTCYAVRYRTECPEIPDESEVEEEPPPPDEEPRYRLMPLPDLTSKYVKEMEDKGAAKVQAETDKIEETRRQNICELEMPPPDPIDGWRIHGWVLVLPGSMGVEEPFFIEPSEGKGYPLDEANYQRLDCIYNHENYYVNLQNCQEGLDKISYDLTDLACWEHLLAGEPFHRRQLGNVDYDDKATAVDTDKHLDMPASWVERLDITADEYEQRYPGSHKTIHYKKVILEKFSRYSERDGIVKRIKIFQDYALTVPLLTYEYYQNREDLMHFSKFDHVNRIAKRTFLAGRKEHLLKHTHPLDCAPCTIEVDRIMEFNYYPRTDHLTKIVTSALTFQEYYTDREDRLESRLVVYKESSKLEPRKLLTIIETYTRNPDIPAKDDIWKRIFHIQANQMELQYHYAYNFITNNSRTFIKPNLAETGGKILFYPDKTSGYIADPVAPQPRPLTVYHALCDNLDWEYNTSKHIRDRESDVITYLRERHREQLHPQLYVSLFDTERNLAAKKGWKEQEIAKAEVTEREKEAEIDPLAPYLARMFGSGHGSGQPLTYKEACLVREQCINDFKAKQLARQNLVMERFDKTNTEYKNKRLWYLANQYILTATKEEAYFKQSAMLAFEVHVLEVRLTRHRDLSGPRFKVLRDYLDKHPLLREYNKANELNKH